MDMKLSKEPDFNADPEEENNRYSLKGENMLPMCIEANEIGLSHSDVYAYHVATFQ
jgi:hypothetical protein